MTPKRAVLKAIRSYLPDKKETNADLAREFGDWDVKKIFDKTGISVRSIAAPGECASDMGANAAQKLFQDGLLTPEQVDFLIFCTQSPDFFLPASACLIQARLGLRTSCGAIDVNQGCSGYVYSLALAKGLIESGTADNILLITGDTYSRYIHPADRSVRTIFGDGAAASWVGADGGEERIGPFILGTDGSGAKHLIVEAGATRMPAAEAGAASPETQSPKYLYMNGGEVFTFTLAEVPRMIGELLLRANIAMEQVDYFVFHQANRFMLEQLRRKLRIPPEKFCMNLESYGNTVSSTIPMAMEIANAEGKIGPGARIIVAGFGVGYSWAGTVLTIP